MAVQCLSPGPFFLRAAFAAEDQGADLGDRLCRDGSEMVKTLNGQISSDLSPPLSNQFNNYIKCYYHYTATV